MAKRGIVYAEALGSFDMGDGTYAKNASNYEVIEDVIAGRVSYYITQLDAISLISTDNKTWVQDAITPQDGAYTQLYVGSTLDGVLKRQLGNAIITWTTPLTEVSQVV